MERIKKLSLKPIERVKNFYKKKYFLLSVSTIIILAIVFLISKNYNLFCWFKNFTPNTSFISDVIAYQAAIIAIAIPLSLDIIARISERYQSGVITKYFNQQWQFRVLLIILILNTLIGITFKFFFEKVISTPSKVITFLILAAFLISNIILVCFFVLLIKYTTDIDFLSELLFKKSSQALNSLKNDTNTSSLLTDSQIKFSQSLEGESDILVFCVKNRKSDKYIIKALRKIQNQVCDLFDINRASPNHFEKILYGNEFRTIYENDPDEASLRLLFMPEDYLIALMTCLSPFLRLYQASVEIKNHEIERYSIYNIIWFMQHIAKDKGHYQSIKAILNILEDLRFSSHRSQFQTNYTLDIEWFTETVFNHDFRIEYFDVFVLSFINCLQRMISNNENKLFYQLIRTIYDSRILLSSFDSLSHTDTYLINSNFNSYSSANQHESFNSLIRLSSRIITSNDLNTCMKKLEEIREDINEKYDPELHNEINQRFDQVSNGFKSQYKFRNLILIMFYAGAYCIFKNRFDYIHKLWNFRQPNDADAIWVGEDITPSSLPGLFNFYLQFEGKKSLASFPWEDHHGSGKYLDQYFLLLVMREFLKTSIQNDQDWIDMINNFQLNEPINPNYEHEIIYFIDNLLQLTSSLENLNLDPLGINKQKVNKSIEQGIIPWLTSLKTKVSDQVNTQKRKTRVSSSKIEKFKQDFIESYSKLETIKHVFSFYRLFSSINPNKDNDDEENVESKEESSDRYISIKEFADKEIFLDEWKRSNTYGDIYASRCVKSKESCILKTIAMGCERMKFSIENNNFIDFLSELKTHRIDIQNCMIIGVNYNFFELSLNSSFFIPKDDSQSDLVSGISSLNGYYNFQDHRIPIFKYSWAISSKQNLPRSFILLLDSKKLGIFNQYVLQNSLSASESQKYFNISIQAYNDSDELMNSILQEKPEWLTKDRNENQQRQFLETQVLIHIYEKFKFELASNFIGFLFPKANDVVDELIDSESVA